MGLDGQEILDISLTINQSAITAMGEKHNGLSNDNTNLAVEEAVSGLVSSLGKVGISNDGITTGVSITEALPVYTILTLAASRSEMYGNAVLTNEEIKQKLLISSPFQGTVKTIIHTNNIIREKPEDYDAKVEYMWAATMVFNGLTTTGLFGLSFPNHMIEHALSAIYNVAHGAGFAIVMLA